MSNHRYHDDWYENDKQLKELYQHNPHCTEITVIGLGLTNLSFLTQFRQLKTLYVGGICHTGTHPDDYDTIQDFSALCHLPQLRYLQIYDCSHFDKTQLEYVAQIPQLRGLSMMSYLMAIDDFGALRRHPRLQALAIENVEDLTFLRHLRDLRFLHIRNQYDDRRIQSFAPVGGLSQLQECIIEIAAPKRIDLRPLSGIQTLKLLDLSSSYADVHAPHLAMLKSRLPHCCIISASQPTHTQTRRTFRAGIEGLFREWIEKLETSGTSSPSLP